MEESLHLHGGTGEPWQNWEHGGLHNVGVAGTPDCVSQSGQESERVVQLGQSVVGVWEGLG